MGYAVELYFDSQTEHAVRALRGLLLKQGILPTLQRLDDRPHVSLAVLPNADPKLLISVTKEHAAETGLFGFQLSAIGMFPTDQNVLFLSPVRTEQLSNCHLEFHRRLAECGLTPLPYYLPENWVPHCSVEMNIPDEQFAKAVETCKRQFEPLHGRFEEIGVIEFRPIQRLGIWPLFGRV
jgi:2'-5' RNA ligase